jgi:hypothetical protein
VLTGSMRTAQELREQAAEEERIRDADCEDGAAPSAGG